MHAIKLGLFASRIEAVCDEMGAVLRRTAFSPNIKDRLDFSCAVFDAGGQLCAQAAHIPVHLGSMAYAMADIVSGRDWQRGDMLVVNDPYLGGTHLPDVTLVAPVFVTGELLGFVANRAHHANIGADSPGSMPISRHLEEEGIVIAPSFIQRRSRLDEALFGRLCGGQGEDSQAAGDFRAQMSANAVGVKRLTELIEGTGTARFRDSLEALNGYAERLARNSLLAIPAGSYEFTDLMDDDGLGATDIPICVRVTVNAGEVEVNFTGTGDQVSGNINCPLPVTAAAVFYVFRCLMPPQTPGCAGSFRPIRLTAPEGSLVNARRPAAVAAGNVETSSRIVDAVLGALACAIPERIPAASQGTMNNIAMGAREPAWDYYETLGGGTGGSARSAGLSGVQSHMTNTLNTPVESLESHYPLRVTRYALRRGSEGAGRNPGGAGLLREYQFLAPAEVTLLTERRRRGPWGAAGGADGSTGENRLNGQLLPGKCQLQVAPGDVLTLATPGGGGWGGPGRE
ncbi:hydantoinase B/oxoprolinase family protein [Proteobacteria bacterium 005FR1]|nr:hydantoinase B/oxoprolinase family protein [Proteobacteria bacterium 005FR1]